MQISDFTQPINIGDPFKLIYDVNTLYGRISGFNESSAKYGTEYAVVVLCTPYGSTLEVGRAYIERIVSECDIQKLCEYEQQAINDGQLLYGGKVNI